MCVGLQVTDPRTAKPIAQLYQDDCKPAGSVFYGVDAKLDADGKVVDPGRVNGTLVVEIKGWESIMLTSMVFAIIAEELVRAFLFCMLEVAFTKCSCIMHVGSLVSKSRSSKSPIRVRWRSACLPSEQVCAPRCM